MQCKHKISLFEVNIILYPRVFDLLRATIIVYMHEYLTSWEPQYYFTCTNIWPLEGHNIVLHARIFDLLRATIILYIHEYLTSWGPQYYFTCTSIWPLEGHSVCLNDPYLHNWETKSLYASNRLTLHYNSQLQFLNKTLRGDTFV